MQQLSKESMTNTALGAMLVGQQFGVNKEKKIFDDQEINNLKVTYCISLPLKDFYF